MNWFQPVRMALKRAARLPLFNRNSAKAPCSERQVTLNQSHPIMFNDANIADGLVIGQRFVADTRLIEADANKQNTTPKDDCNTAAIKPENAPRAVRKYLDVLDDAACGAATAQKAPQTGQDISGTAANVQSLIGKALALLDRHQSMRQ